jgi:hypothetical protein
MKHFVDIHTILSTAQDMDDIHDEPEAASDKLNEVLHLVYAKFCMGTLASGQAFI